MRIILTFLIVLLILTSCKKQKFYQPLTGKALDFVSYTAGQSIKLIDTNNVTHTLLEDTVVKEYYQIMGITGSTGQYYEIYQAQFYVPNQPIGILVNVEAKLYPPIQGTVRINMCGYAVEKLTDSLPPTIPVMTINGTDYFNVYSFKASYFTAPPFTNDTARLYFNKEHGAIQLLFPGGKSITRIN
jgi:hypothetical protein